MELQQAYEQARAEFSDPWKQRKILDYTLLNTATDNIRYLQERMAKKITVLTTLGEKVGREKKENSLKILLDPI